MKIWNKFTSCLGSEKSDLICWKVKHPGWFVISISIGSRALERRGNHAFVQFSSLSLFSCTHKDFLARTREHTGGQVPEISPYNKSLGNIPLYRRPNLITADPKFGQSLCCKFFNGIAVGTSTRDFSLRVSNRNCTLNIFEWNLRASSGNKTWRENRTAVPFLLVLESHDQFKARSACTNCDYSMTCWFNIKSMDIFFLRVDDQRTNRRGGLKT